jgi:hypothetical protein
MSPAYILKFVTVVVLLVLPSQTTAAPQQDARRLGIDVQAGQDGDYDKAIQIAKRGGAQFVSMSINWEDIEPTPNKYGSPYLQIADTYYPAQHLQVRLCLRSLDTNGPHIPPDLRNLPMDSPLVIERFEQMADDTLVHLSHVSLTSLGLGNEVDAPLGADAKKWAQFRRFFKAVKAHLKIKYPKLLIGVPTTFAGTMGSARNEIKALNAASDLIMITYYPLKSDFTVEDPDIVLKDFDRLTKLYEGRKIVFVEAGYPSGGACGSSEAKQAQFVRCVFQAWDAHAGQIPAVSFCWLNDKSAADVDGFVKYYSIDTVAFRELLLTLGLRTNDDTDKEGFRVLTQEAKARGWRGDR